MCERNKVLTTNQVRKMNDMYQTRHQLSVCIRYPWDTEKWIVKKQGVAVMFNTDVFGLVHAAPDEFSGSDGSLGSYGTVQHFRSVHTEL